MKSCMGCVLVMFVSVYNAIFYFRKSVWQQYWCYCGSSHWHWPGHCCCLHSCLGGCCLLLEETVCPCCLCILARQNAGHCGASLSNLASHGRATKMS